MNKLTSCILKDAPSLIESVFPAQKVSIEAQTERKAVQSQTLTGLGSYWKGRKPLILVRAIILGCLLPQTDDAKSDLEIFELLMGFDDGALARRAFALNTLKPIVISEIVNLSNPWDYFSHSIKDTDDRYFEVDSLCFPLEPSHAKNLNIKWRRDIKEEEKVKIFRLAIESFSTYEEKSSYCRRPEELNPDWLYQTIWPSVNSHYSHLGINVNSHKELIDQLGLLRYGRTPQVGDAFAGGGSIPYEAARLGCSVYASDLNPIACMLNWGNLNIIGADESVRKEIEYNQNAIAEAVDKEICSLGIEHDENGNRAKAYLYCVETKCPETGWMVPLIPSFVVSKLRKAVVKILPDYDNKRFDIDLCTNASPDDMKDAEKGTVRDSKLIYELDGNIYSTPIKTLRGDYKASDGQYTNRLRKWGKHDTKPAPDDVFQERLYCIQWITKETINSKRQDTFFASVTSDDLNREKLVQEIVASKIIDWQSKGLIPDMQIEAGYNTNQPIRERGWTYWHHLFAPRQIHFIALVAKYSVDNPYAMLFLSKLVDWNSKLCRYGTGAARESIAQTFYNQAFNTFFNYGVRSFGFSRSYLTDLPSQSSTNNDHSEIVCTNADSISTESDLWITDPPYADAVNYHEITEFFIAWLRKNPPQPFDSWTWDSRRALAIKGAGDDFRRGMVNSYSAMASHMPGNGMQCVMFTHQDTGVWSDMVGIFWAAGLQVVSAWYIATETSTELKKGGYVQGTVILMLRKRPTGENMGFKQRLLPAVRTEVQNQIETMMHLNDEVKEKMGEPVFNDSDLQMAGYAAALKILTSYTHIGGEDVTSFALKPRIKGGVTVVDEIVQQAAEAANNLLVPEGLNAETWHKLSGLQRFYLRMMDIETTGASKLDNYQNFAKAFRVEDYTRIMGNMTANSARLKYITEFTSRDLTESTEIGKTWLGQLMIGIQQLLLDVEPQAVVSQLQADLPDFIEIRPVLIDLLLYIERKAPEKEIRDVVEVFSARLRNIRALGQ